MSIRLNLTPLKRRVFNETFRKRARPGVPVDLSYPKGSVREAAQELGIESGRISKWRQQDTKPAQSGKSHTDLTDGQKQIRPLQKQLKEAPLERIPEATRDPKKGGQHLCQGRPHRRTGEMFRFIKEHANQFPPVRRCG